MTSRHLIRRTIIIMHLQQLP